MLWITHGHFIYFRDLSTRKILTLAHETNSEPRPQIWSSPDSPKSGDLFVIVASASPSIQAVCVWIHVLGTAQGTDPTALPALPRAKSIRLQRRVSAISMLQDCW